MSNNPGRRGKAAPWTKRATERRQCAEEDYRQAHHRAYAEWKGRRSATFHEFSVEAEAKHSSFSTANREANKLLRKWDKSNPNPMTWDEHQALTAAFSAQYSDVGEIAE